MNVWKVLGIAGVVGVAAGGVVLARAERRRRLLGRLSEPLQRLVTKPEQAEDLDPLLGVQDEPDDE